MLVLYVQQVNPFREVGKITSSFNFFDLKFVPVGQLTQDFAQLFPHCEHIF